MLYPSRSWLQKMINICEQFGIDFQVTFNDKKTQCICFSKPNDTGYWPVTLNNKRFKWESKVNHLGNILNQRLNDDDLRKKKGHFIGSLNKMFSNFANMQSVVLTTLFKRYCCTFYGCTLWKLNKMCTNDICTSWNKAIMKMWKLPPTAHTCFLGPLNEQ